MCFGSSDKDYPLQPPRIHRVDGSGRYQFQRFPNSHIPGRQERERERERQPMPTGAPFPPSSGHQGPEHGHHNPHGRHGSSGHHHFASESASASASRNLPDGPVPPGNPGDPAGWRYRGRMYYQRDPSDTSVDPRMNEPGWFFLHPGRRGGGRAGGAGGAGRARPPGGSGTGFPRVPRNFPGVPGDHPGGHRGGGGRTGGRRGGRGGRGGGANVYGSHPGRGHPSEFGRGY